MGAKLIAEEGPLKGQEFDLQGRAEWRIGRDPTVAEIILEDPSVSREHLVIRTSPEGLIAENLSETNPLQINDLEIHEPQLLHSGDGMRIGDGIYRFLSEEREMPPEEPSVLPTRDTLFEEDTGSESLLADIDLDLSDTAPWLLKVISGPNAGAQFSMHPDTSYIIGTDPASCDIVFHDVSVSRQHARVTLSKEGMLMIEDLKSSNGTVVDGAKIEGKTKLTPNTLISLGTSSFVIYDRESERTTIISPLMPSIVKILKEHEEKLDAAPKKEEEKGPSLEEIERERARAEEENLKRTQGEKQRRTFFGILVALIGLFALLFVLLFKPVEVAKPAYDSEKLLQETLAPFPKVRLSYTESSGKLFLTGHVQSKLDLDEIRHELESYPFIKSIDNNIIVDELIWQEQNQILSRNPSWKGVSIHAPEAGKFVITGYLQTRKQAEALDDFLSQNFPYLDLLQQNIYVEEDITNRISIMLLDAGMQAVDVKSLGGDIILSGNIPFGEKAALDDVVTKAKEIPGVREIKAFVTEQAPAASMVDLTGEYKVSGFLQQPGGKISVVIKGKILSEGDYLDGRLINKIDPSVIYLESKGVKYKIDYNQ